MEKRSVYTNLILLTVGSLHGGERPLERPPLRRMITRTISIDDMAPEVAEENYKRMIAAEQANLIISPPTPNSPPIPPVPQSPRRRSRSPIPLRRLLINPGQPVVNPFSPSNSPHSAELTPSPSIIPLDEEETEGARVAMSVFLRLMDREEGNGLPGAPDGEGPA